MEKLIKLLNEYNIELHWVDRTYKDGFDLWYEQEYMRDFRVAYLISKSFWFIEWLVQNDKIDTDELLGIYWETSQSIWEANKYELYPAYKRLLMLLALQDDPIKFLISVLK